MSPWWLLLIVPVCLTAGVFLGALCAAAGMESRRQEAEAAAPVPVIVRATRYVPDAQVMEKIFDADKKTADAWLAASMGGPLGALLVPYARIRTAYRPDHHDYQVTAAVKVVPMEGKK